MTSHRDLGVTVDKTLKFHIHINLVVNKAWGLDNQLLRCTVNRSPGFMVSLFVSHIRPIMDYCSTVWNLGYAGDLKRLESVQRRWTREISGLGGLDYQSRLRHLELFSIRGRMLRADLVKVWKIFHTEIDVGLSHVFERQSHGATRGHPFKLSVPLCRTEIRRRFFNVRTVQTWNSLTEEAVCAASLEGFKRLLDAQVGDRFYIT